MEIQNTYVLGVQESDKVTNRHQVVRYLIR